MLYVEWERLLSKDCKGSGATKTKKNLSIQIPKELMM
jgi:hypothetical protein